MTDTDQSLIGQFSKIADSFQKYIVRPANAFGLGGFVFDVECETSVRLSAEITDHYVEDNSAVQDHMAVKPEKVILKRYVGELVYNRDEKSNTKVQKVVQKMTTLSAYIPQITAAAQQANNIYKAITTGTISTNPDNYLDGINEATDLWSMVKNITPPTPKQQAAFLYFKSLMTQKIVVSLQTPFEFLDNMLVESIEARQEDNSIYYSDFSITLKQLRTADLTYVTFDKSKYQSRTVDQAAPVATSYQVQGQQIPTVSQLNEGGGSFYDTMTAIPPGDIAYSKGSVTPPPLPTLQSTDQLIDNPIFSSPNNVGGN